MGIFALSMLATWLAVTVLVFYTGRCASVRFAVVGFFGYTLSSNSGFSSLTKLNCLPLRIPMTCLVNFSCFSNWLLNFVYSFF